VPQLGPNIAQCTNETDIKSLQDARGWNSPAMPLRDWAHLLPVVGLPINIRASWLTISVFKHAFSPYTAHMDLFLIQPIRTLALVA